MTSSNSSRTTLLHLAIVCASALSFSWLPSLVTGIPLRNLLSSDAEFYMALAAMLKDPELFARDPVFSHFASVRPGLENHLHLGIEVLAQNLGSDPNGVSVVLSIAALLVFACALYFLVRSTLKDSTLALLITLLCVIPVHALGATTFGFQALGFLPRDGALALSLIALFFYFQEIDDPRQLTFVFLACGVLANFYVLVFVHLVGTLLLAELLRTRRPQGWLVVHALIFVAFASPVLIESFKSLGWESAIDMEIVKSRNPYMFIFPLGDAFLTTLRRVLIYAVLDLVMWWAIVRYALGEERRNLVPWAYLTLSAGLISAFGVVLENSTNFVVLHLSRTSIYFILGSMMICGLGLQAILRPAARLSARPLGLLAFAGLLLFQSNLPSIYRYLRDAQADRQERREILETAAWLRANTTPADLIMAPSPESKDLALTFRCYSLRPVFFSYKDGGIAMTDGRRGREWMERFHAQDDALKANDVEMLLSFMRQRDIAFAVLPEALIPQVSGPESRHAAHRIGKFAVLPR